MTPDICYLPFYSSLLLLLWSPILPEPQARLTTPHHFLDLAYTLFPPRVPITQFVSLAYSLSFPSSPTPPFSIWTLPAHCYIFSTHFPLIATSSPLTSFSFTMHHESTFRFSVQPLSHRRHTPGHSLFSLFPLPSSVLRSYLYKLPVVDSIWLERRLPLSCHPLCVKHFTIVC